MVRLGDHFNWKSEFFKKKKNNREISISNVLRFGNIEDIFRMLLRWPTDRKTSRLCVTKNRSGSVYIIYTFLYKYWNMHSINIQKRLCALFSYGCHMDPRIVWTYYYIYYYFCKRVVCKEFWIGNTYDPYGHDVSNHSLSGPGLIYFWGS